MGQGATAVVKEKNGFMLANGVVAFPKRHAGTAAAWRLIHRNLPFLLMFVFSYLWSSLSFSRSVEYLH